jgi:hypothetical protein
LEKYIKLVNWEIIGINFVTNKKKKKKKVSVLSLFKTQVPF